MQHKAHWSSGQDIALSRRKQGFDSPMGHQKSSHIFDVAVFLSEMESNPVRVAAFKKTVYHTVFLTPQPPRSSIPVLK